jgi:hydroxymethylpyrimidine kinase/phosphomethylpyrimidine kinase/thiamine-phosphate diphosphorylase
VSQLTPIGRRVGQKIIKKIWPTVWTIAGSDSGGGAGIQGDLKTIHALGAHGCSVLTAVTAQNPREIIGLERVSDALISAQMAALKSEFSPSAVKTGVLGSSTSVASLAASLKELEAWVVCDPVLVSSSGHSLANREIIRAMKESLFPVVDLLTPNIPEAEALLDRALTTPADLVQAASDLRSFGAKQVLIKGGHAIRDFSSDYWTDGSSHAWFHSFRQPAGKAHGTGCMLASAIAASRAQGLGVLDAICVAKAFVNRALRLSYRVAGGSSVLFTAPWPQDAGADDLPWITDDSEVSLSKHFADCGTEKLGFYPIVDRASWIARLLPEGVKTIQLRIKDLTGEALRNEIANAVRLTRQSDCRLFINDHWEIALEHGAYGVHLGPEDLHRCEVEKLRAGGVRLGVSAYSYAGAARAHALRPSYLAIGPIYPTATKALPYPPQGIDGIRRWKQVLNYPLVAIGGITLERAAEVAETGVDGVSVVTDLQRAENIEARARAWLELFARR